MTVTDIRSAIDNLKNKRVLFHSEADFQFSLAWELQRLLPDAKIRLEYCPVFDNQMHIDIYILDGDQSYPIELKYKTRKIVQSIHNEQYNLKDQGAQDLGRFDFLYDINRLEKVKKLDSAFQSGYAIILTNDPSYWNTPAFQNTADEAFRIHDGKTVTGLLSWGDTMGSKTGNNRKPFELQGEYRMSWMPYSTVGDHYGEFQFCLIEVM